MMPGQVGAVLGSGKRVVLNLKVVKKLQRDRTRTGQGLWSMLRVQSVISAHYRRGHVLSACRKPRGPAAPGPYLLGGLLEV